MKLHPFEKEWASKPYNAFPVWFKKKYGERYQKISIDAGFTCPNRDGKVAEGGCTYCNNQSFTPSYCITQDQLYQQISEGIVFFSKRYRRASKFLAYLQSYSNTYKSLPDLKFIYEQLLSHPNVHGLVIATRPDCINEPLVDYLEELAKEVMIFLEIGIESCYNGTLKSVNRGHTFEQTQSALKLVQGRGIHITGHLLFGLPGESHEMMLDQADIISELPLDSLKFHQLQIIKGTKMAKQYLATPDTYHLFEFDEYLDFIISFLERLRPEITIQRFFNETPPRYRLAPDWGLVRSDVLTAELEKKMIENGTWQGRSYNKRHNLLVTPFLKLL